MIQFMRDDIVTFETVTVNQHYWNCSPAYPKREQVAGIVLTPFDGYANVKYQDPYFDTIEIKHMKNEDLTLISSGSNEEVSGN